MTTVKYPIAVIAVFLWIGFVCAISFMEAWLKFKAPGITLPLGLGIGRLVFSALNKIEWVFAIAIIVTVLIQKSEFVSLGNLLFVITLLILIVQTFWMLPALDTRAEMYIQGHLPAPSRMHFYYIGVEIVKTICLIVFGISLFK